MYTPRTEMSIRNQKPETPTNMSSHRFKPRYDESESEDDHLGAILDQKEESDDDFSSLSFGALSSAQKKLRDEEPPKRKTSKKAASSHQESDSESDGGFFEDDKKDRKDKKGRKKDITKSKNKHAPAESSSKRPVSKVREIPGLKSAKETTLYSDVRFDAAYGKADWNRIRKDYAFLDEYRQSEIKQMQSVLKDKKQVLKLSQREVEDLKFEIQSLQSRLDTLKNRDLANKIVGDHKKEQMEKTRRGEQVNPYFLKKSEQRKMIQKAKFENLRAGQREKVMERKRKRRLGKEFKQLEFRNGE